MSEIKSKPLKVKILDEKLRKWGLPERATSGSAAVDLRACISSRIEIAPGQRVGIPTGIAIAIDDAGLCAQILSRSGLGAVRGLTVAQGVGLIDSDYRGEIKVFLINTSSMTLSLEPGERIAQLVLTPVISFHWDTVESLENTNRGSGGFGSTD